MGWQQWRAGYRLSAGGKVIGVAVVDPGMVLAVVGTEWVGSSQAGYGLEPVYMGRVIIIIDI